MEVTEIAELLVAQGKTVSVAEADTMGLIGSPEYCAERIKQAEAAGMEHLYLMTDQTYEFAKGELAAFRDKIFPALANSKQLS